MSLFILFLALLTVLLSPIHWSFDVESTPIKALYITGGGYHDYKTLKPLLTASISRYANAEFTVVNNIDGMKNPDFTKGYDVVVYNMCFSDPTLDLVPIEKAV